MALPHLTFIDLESQGQGHSYFKVISCKEA